MISKQIFFSGHVQGVGFRYSVKQVAHGFDLTGWIRNLPDGRVELQIAGKSEEIAAFLDEIAHSHLRAHIRETAEHPLTEPPVARGFEIKHD